MKFSTPITALFIALTSISTTTACNADGCLRALAPTRDPARLAQGAAFCATYIAAIPARTDISGAPASATKACGSKPSAYSSACSCIPITEKVAPRTLLA